MQTNGLTSWKATSGVKDDSGNNNLPHPHLEMLESTLSKHAILGCPLASAQVLHSLSLSMTAQHKLRPSVPGTRKREGAKNLPVKALLGTWNVRLLNTEGNIELLLNEMTKFKIDVLGVAETHWNNEITEAFDEHNFLILHSCRRDGIKRQGVAIIVEKQFAKHLTSYECYSERLISATFATDEGPTTIFQVYAPDSSYSDELVESFYDTLQSKIDTVPKNHNYILLGDFNAKVGGDQHDTWPEVVGRYGLGKANERGLQLLQFCAINNLVISNTLYRHSEKRRATWLSPSGRNLNQIDFVIIQNKAKHILRNSRAYHSAEIGSDHFPVLAKFEFKMQKPRNTKTAPRRYDAEKLIQNKELAHEFEVKLGGAFAPLIDLENKDIEVLYSAFKEATNNITEEIAGHKRRKHVDGLPQSVEKACEERRHARAEMLNNPQSKEKKLLYKQLNKSVKHAVKMQKNCSLEKKIEQLELDFKQNNSHNLFKTVRDIEGKPRKAMSAVKDKQGNTHTNKSEVLKCWEEHFNTHLNTSFPHQPTAINEIPEAPEDAENLPPISEEEIERAVRKMKFRKAPGIDAITSEALTAGGKPMIEMLHKIFNQIWKNEKTPKDWARMMVTPIHKKGDKLNPGNYRAISLLSIPGKVFSRILLERMKKRTERATGESQFGFRPGRGTVDAIFIVRQIIEKAKEHQVPLHFNFVDFKAAFDTVWRKALWKMMLAIGVDPKLVRIIESLYNDTECAVVIDGNLTEWFKVEIGLRQGCLLSPTLFNIFLEFVMKELKDLDENLQLQENLSIDIRYADDTTLLSAVFEKLQLTTTQLEQACQKWGMKINGAKCKIISPSDQQINIDGQEVEHVEEFVFLGSVVPDSAADIKRRIALASVAFGRLREAIWKKKTISIPIKVRLYKALIEPIATYAAETWTLRAEDTRMLEVFEMRCLRAILGVTRRDRLSNDKIREALKVNNTISDVIRRKRLRWFGHITRRPTKSYVAQAYRQDFNSPRPRGRPPKKWITQVREDTGLPIATAERYAADRAEDGGTGGRVV